MTPRPTGTITFLFSDIEGSTARWEAHGEAMQAALRRHDELMHVIIERHGGHVFKTVGDEFCTAFSRPSDAVAAAIDAQSAIAAEDWRAVNGLRLRMAIHSGVTDERDGDYFGPTVNRVARLLAAGHGEQILVSNATAQLLNGQLRASLRDLGAHRFKDLPQPEAVFQVNASGLRQAFPPLRTVAENPTNVPLPLTSLLGREDELATVASMLASGRLVTLTGSGGVGKTRIAQQIAIDTLARYADGVWLVDLAPLSSAELVPSTVASALGVETRDLVPALKDKQLLIVLDNCEHVLAVAAQTVQTLLQRCSGVCVLATGRESLGVAGERTFRVPSLPEESSVALFCDRARAVNSRFELTADAQSPVREIVRRLDGIALAIELAASRVKILSVERIAKGLDERFKLLAGGSRAALPRQQTLRALIGWSYDLLSEQERSMLQQLAVFRGGWALDAALEICVDERFDDWDPLGLLESIVEKSLAVVDERPGEVRYRLLESTREYALQRLNESGVANETAARHCAYYRRQAEEIFASYWNVSNDQWHGRVRPDCDNYRGAVDWGLSKGNDPVAAAAIVSSVASWLLLPDFNNLLSNALAALPSDAPQPVLARVRLTQAHKVADAGPRDDSAAAAAALYQRLGDREHHAEALMWVGNSLRRSGDLDAAVEKGEEAVRMAAEAGLVRLQAQALLQLGAWLAMKGEAQRGRPLLERAESILDELGDSGRLSVCLNNLAEVLFTVGDYAGALERARRALALDRERGYVPSLATRHVNIAAYLLALGEPEAAWEEARDGLQAATARGDRMIAAVAVGHLASIAARDGDVERAARLMGYVDAVYEAFGFVREPTERLGYDAARARIVGTLGAVPAGACFSAGATLSDQAATTDARQVARPSRAVTTPEPSAL